MQFYQSFHVDVWWLDEVRELQDFTHIDGVSAVAIELIYLNEVHICRIYYIVIKLPKNGILNVFIW